MADQEANVDDITRFEVIDQTGRAYVVTGIRLDISIQDEGRTLKVFVSNRATK